MTAQPKPAEMNRSLALVLNAIGGTLIFIGILIAAAQGAAG